MSLKKGDWFKVTATGRAFRVSQYVPNMVPPIVAEGTDALFMDAEVVPLNAVPVFGLELYTPGTEDVFEVKHYCSPECRSFDERRNNEHPDPDERFTYALTMRDRAEAAECDECGAEFNSITDEMRARMRPAGETIIIPPAEPAGYNDLLDGDEQVAAEEEIAALVFDIDRPGEERSAELGRTILRRVLERFRPDLFEGGRSPFRVLVKIDGGDPTVYADAPVEVCVVDLDRQEEPEAETPDYFKDLEEEGGVEFVRDPETDVLVSSNASGKVWPETEAGS